MIPDIFDTKSLMPLMWDWTDAFDREKDAMLRGAVEQQLAVLDVPALLREADAQVQPEKRRYGYGERVLNLTPYGWYHPSLLRTTNCDNAGRGRLWRSPGRNAWPEHTFGYDYDAEGILVRNVIGVEPVRPAYVTVWCFDDLWQSALTTGFGPGAMPNPEDMLVALCARDSDGFARALAFLTIRNGACVEADYEAYGPLIDGARVGCTHSFFVKENRVFTERWNVRFDAGRPVEWLRAPSESRSTIQ